MYKDRLRHYVPFEIKVITGIKSAGQLTQEILKVKEGELILKEIAASDQVVLLDERGKTYSSAAFSNFIQKKGNEGIKKLIFVIGGAYGFSENVYKRAHQSISLSQMTFSHQMVRLFFVEQLYRAMTIIKNEKYHH